MFYDLFTILPFQVEVVSGVHSTVHPLLVPRNSTFDSSALRSRFHSKLLQIINIYHGVGC